MAVLDSNAAALTPVTRAVLAQLFWAWFHDHADHVIVSRRVVLFTVTIRVRDLRPLFVTLFGGDPVRDGFVIPVVEVPRG